MAKGAPLASGSLALALCLHAMGTHAGPDGVMAVRELLTRHASEPGVSIQVKLPENSVRQLADCRQPDAELAGHSPPRWGSLTVRVTCGPSDRPRFIRAQVTAIGTYWVLAQDVAAGAPIHADLLQSQRGDLTRLPSNAITGTGELDGQVAARPLRTGTVLQSHWLKTPAMVKRRDRVTLRVEGRGFRVTRDGRALDEGGLGERVRIRLDNREVVTGIVSGAGTVRLPAR